MTTVDEHGRVLPPVDGDEATSLLGFLDHQRATLAWKCAGLDADGLRTRVGRSTMTLGGLLKHMALVEEAWFSQRLHGEPLGRPWSEVDWTADPDWEWRTAADDDPDELRALWQRAVDRSRERTARTLAEGGLDTSAARRRRDGSRPTLRWILLHMIEEYARHNGHADLLREAVDCSTGD